MFGSFDLGLDLGGYDFQRALYAQSPVYIPPELVGGYYDVFNPALIAGFSQAPSVYDGLNSMMSIVNIASGGLYPYVPVDTGFF